MSDGEARKILLVENDEQGMNLLSWGLRGVEQCRFIIDWVPSLELAHEKVSLQRYDVVLIGLQLTESVGLASLNDFRKAAPQIPVVVVANEPAGPTSWQVLRTGAQGYIIKDDFSSSQLWRTIEDAIERHRMMESIIHSERIASVEELSAGIAHEINSPLAQVYEELSEIKNCLIEEKYPSALSRSIDRAFLRVEDIREAVRALYSLPDIQNIRPKLFDAAEAVRFARSAANNYLREVPLFQEKIRQLPQVYGDQGRYTRAILDLLIHVSEVARACSDRAGQVLLEAYTSNEWVVVAVEDNGPSVPFELRNKLLHSPNVPRAEDWVRGAGLSLVAAREAAEEHYGGLEVMSSRYGGARFELSVPKAETTSRTAEASSECRVVAHRAKILWIDDDVNLLRAFQRRLSRDHDVDVCASAMEALARIDEGERWDVICCDLMMPETNGRQFEEILSSRYPALAARLIFVTGGVFSEEERRFLEQSRQPKLLKPFDWDAFLKTVEEVRA